jgi:hypothetical protein
MALIRTDGFHSIRGEVIDAYLRRRVASGSILQWISIRPADLWFYDLHIA